MSLRSLSSTADVEAPLLIRIPHKRTDSNSSFDTTGTKEEVWYDASPSTGTQDDETETKPLTASTPKGKNNGGGITMMGLKVLVLLVVQNSSKNLLMRFVMKEKPNFLTSAAVINVECIKIMLSTLYILLIEKKSPATIVEFFVHHWKNTLLVLVPATAYNMQMTLEYIALTNLDAAIFSVLVQSKLLFTATFAALVLRKKLKYIQVVSLVLLTVGVMLCNMKVNNSNSEEEEDVDKQMTKGVLATLGIALSSGFASVYTEKVIKTQRPKAQIPKYSLAYTQIQLASMGLLTIGIYAGIMDYSTIVEHGLYHNFTKGACLTVVNSAVGGLIVAAVLKYADSVLKGYATAISVIMTGLLSMGLFGTQLHAVYFMGVVLVMIAVLLYNGNNLDKMICS